MDPSSGTAPPSQGTKQSSNNRSPRLSVLEPDIRSPSGSFTWMSKQAKAPGTLLLGSPEQEVYGRKSCISISDSITSPTGRQSPCSPRLVSIRSSQNCTSRVSHDIKQHLQKEKCTDARTWSLSLPGTHCHSRSVSCLYKQVPWCT